MRQRTKEPLKGWLRRVHPISAYNQGWTTQTWSPESMEDNVPGPGSCYHEKIIPWWGYHDVTSGSYSGWRELYFNHFGGAPDFHAYAFEHQKALDDFSNNLNWSKLQSSSDFGLLQFLAEIDDTIAMFSRNFASQIFSRSGGAAVQWGLLPFVADVKALLEQIHNFATSDSQDEPYEDLQRFEVSEDWYTANTELRLSGRVSVPLGQLNDVGLSAAHLLLLYDRLGFHPGLLTAWDLVPLSFVVDWWYPVSEFLAQFEQRGWITHVNFIGWRTIKTKVTDLRPKFYNTLGSPTHGMSIYERKPFTSVLEVPDAEELRRRRGDIFYPDDNFDHGPSPLQVANSVYLELLRQMR